MKEKVPKAMAYCLGLDLLGAEITGGSFWSSILSLIWHKKGRQVLPASTIHPKNLISNQKAVCSLQILTTRPYSDSQINFDTLRFTYDKAAT